MVNQISREGPCLAKSCRQASVDTGIEGGNQYKGNPCPCPGALFFGTSERVASLGYTLLGQQNGKKGQTNEFACRQVLSNSVCLESKEEAKSTRQKTYNYTIQVSPFVY